MLPPQGMRPPWALIGSSLGKETEPAGSGGSPWSLNADVIKASLTLQFVPILVLCGCLSDWIGWGSFASCSECFASCSPP